MTPEIQKQGAAARSRYTEEQRAYVKARWATGKSAAIVAAEMFTVFGLEMSRNALLGLVDRMKLPKRPTTGPWRLNRRQPLSKPIPKPAPPRTDLSAPQPIGPAGDFPAAGLCKWLVKDLPDFQCCGQPQFGRGPYCEHHMAKRKGTQPRVPGAHIRAPF